MEITEFDSARFITAMELFSEGHSLAFSGVGFRLLPPDVLECRIESSWNQGSITEERARTDLRSVYRTIEHLKIAAPAFARLVDDRRPSVVLFAGYGMGGVEVCTESRGVISWEPGFPIDSTA